MHKKESTENDFKRYHCNSPIYDEVYEEDLIGVKEMIDDNL